MLFDENLREPSFRIRNKSACHICAEIESTRCVRQDFISTCINRSITDFPSEVCGIIPFVLRLIILVILIAGLSFSMHNWLGHRLPRFFWRCVWSQSCTLCGMKPYLGDWAYLLRGFGKVFVLREYRLVIFGLTMHGVKPYTGRYFKATLRARKRNLHADRPSSKVVPCVAWREIGNLVKVYSVGSIQIEHLARITSYPSITHCVVPSHTLAKA